MTIYKDTKTNLRVTNEELSEIIDALYDYQKKCTERDLRLGEIEDVRREHTKLLSDLIRRLADSYEDIP